MKSFERSCSALDADSRPDGLMHQFRLPTEAAHLVAEIDGDHRPAGPLEGGVHRGMAADERTGPRAEALGARALVEVAQVARVGDDVRLIVEWED